MCTVVQFGSSERVDGILYVVSLIVHSITPLPGFHISLLAHETPKVIFFAPFTVVNSQTWESNRGGAMTNNRQSFLDLCVIGFFLETDSFSNQAKELCRLCVSLSAPLIMCPPSPLPPSLSLSLSLFLSLSFSFSLSLLLYFSRSLCRLCRFCEHIFFLSPMFPSTSQAQGKKPM